MQAPLQQLQPLGVQHRNWFRQAHLIDQSNPGGISRIMGDEAVTQLGGRELLLCRLAWHMAGQQLLKSRHFITLWAAMCYRRVHSLQCQIIRDA